MRKRVFGRKFNRTTNQRKALFKSLTEALVLHGRITTTEAKAKAIKPSVEKLITRALRNDSNTLSALLRQVGMSTAQRLIVIAPVFAGRPGGYTRIIKMGGRRKDNAPMVLIEFVEKIDMTPVSLKREKKADKATPKATVKESAAEVKTPEKKAQIKDTSKTISKVVKSTSKTEKAKTKKETK